jgi:hypothetical protein
VPTRSAVGCRCAARGSLVELPSLMLSRDTVRPHSDRRGETLVIVDPRGREPAAGQARKKRAARSRTAPRLSCTPL